MNRRISGVLMSYIAIIVKLVVGLLYIPILLSFLNDSEYGLYQLMGSLISYLAVMDFGLSATVIRYYSVAQVTKDQREAENVLGTANRIYIVISMITLAICVGISFLIDPLFSESLTTYEITEAKKIFVVLSANIIITILTNVYLSILNSYERFSFIRLTDMLNSILQLVLIWPAMKLAKTAMSVVIMLFVINLITAGFKILYCRIKLKVRVKYHYYDKQLIKNMLTFSWSVFLVSIADQVYWKTGQVVLGIVSGTAAVAVYGVAAQIYWNYMPISTTIQGVFLPNLTKRIASGLNDKEMSDIFIRIGRVQYLLLGGILAGFALVGNPFIILLAGESKLEAYWICLIVMIPFTIDLIQNIGLVILQAKNMYAFRAKVYLITAAANILLCIVLGRIYGGIGCAIASAICMFIANGIVMNVYYSKKIHINIARFWWNIAQMTIPLLVVLIVSKSIALLLPIDEPIWKLLINGSIFVILYILVMWKFAMNSYEKGIVRNLLGKFGVKK